MKINVEAGKLHHHYHDWTPALQRISDTGHRTVKISVDENEVNVEMYTATVTVIQKRVKDPRKKGVQMMLDICKHCHEMTYLILGFKPLIHCLHCSKEIW